MRENGAKSSVKGCERLNPHHLKHLNSLGKTLTPVWSEQNQRIFAHKCRMRGGRPAVCPRPLTVAIQRGEIVCGPERGERDTGGRLKFS